MTLADFYIATETRIEKAFPSYKRVKEGNKEKLESITNEQQTTLWTTTYRDSTSLIALNLLGMPSQPVRPTLCVEFNFMNKTNFFGSTSLYYKQFYLPFLKKEEHPEKEEDTSLIKIKLNPSEEVFLPTETEEYIEFKRYLEYARKFKELLILEVKDFAMVKEFSPDFGKYSLKEDFIKGYPFVDEENLMAFKVDSSRGTIEGINYLSGYKAATYIGDYKFNNIDEVFKNEVESHLRLTPKEIVTFAEKGMIERISRALNIFSLESTKGEILNKKEERKTGTEGTYVVSDYIGKYFK